MSEPAVPSVTVVALTHDLVRRRSLVTLMWTHDAEKNVALPVPFGCGLDEVHRAAETALRDLSAETATLAVTTPA